MSSPKHDMKKALTGISGILVTPFDADDKLVPELQAPIVERTIDAGVHILVANGNTGEFYALTTHEAETMVRASAEHIAGRIPLLAGVGRGLHDACSLAKASAQAGADALMIHQPPDPFVAPRGIIEYIKRVHDAADGLPMALYLRNDTMGTDAIAELCALEGVIGVKWATTNPMNLARAIAACDSEIVWVNGLAETWATSLYAVGARGFTSGLINVWPERSMEIHAALEVQDYILANKLVREMKTFEDIRAEEMSGTNVTGVKAALQLLNLDCGHARAPSAWPPTEVQSANLAAFIKAHDLKAFA